MSASARRRCFWLLAVLLAIVAVAWPGAMTTRLQDAPAQALPGQPAFRTEANYVRVDVYPTARGVPVADLQRADFEILEDGVPQTIDRFEHVVVRGGAAAGAGREPSTIAESRAQLEASRARVFVIFLDVQHVEPESGRAMRQPLVKMLDALIGPDDLVGVMTPDMSAADVTFARRTTTIEGMLTRRWDWGERGRSTQDLREQAYQQCYPGLGPTQLCPDDDRGVADEMIARRREQKTLSALDDLVQFLRDAREERKGVLVVSDGWRLYRPNNALGRRVNCRLPEPSTGTDPRTGRLTVRPAASAGSVDLTQCEADRMDLANLDDDALFRSLQNRANRSNVSFYAIDPRGLPVFDTPIGQPRTGREAPSQPTIPPVAVDAARLRARQDALRDLATATDGVAVLNSNDLDRGLKRLVDDLSSYYLLGYYSTGRLDGKFHAITVRIKRPGVDVRARRGYLAATEVEIRKAAAPSPDASRSPGGHSASVAAAISSLGGLVRDVPLRLAVASTWVASQTPQWWATGELGAGNEWRAGGEAIATIVNAAGQTVASARTTVAEGARGFRVALDGSRDTAPGDYTLQMRVQPRQPGARSEIAAIPAPLAPAPGTLGAMVSRRGSSTGNRDVPSVDARFSRTERIRVDVPDVPDTSVDVRLLDRSGNPLRIAVAVAPLTDPDGHRWQSAQLPLAPFAPGEFVLEISRSGGGAPSVPLTLVPFRIVP